jgi:flagellar hook protein FlgE
MSVTDALGINHNVTLDLKRTATPSQWSYEINVPDATPAIAGTGTLQFTGGQLDLTAAGTTAAGGATINPALGLDVDINWTDADLTNQTVSLDLTQLTQFGSDSAVTSVNPDGAGVGNVVGVEVDKEGFVYAKFDNGAVRQIAKVGLATFPNPDGLQTVSGNAYRATSASGEFAIKEAGIGGAGLISPSSLEASTVDLSSEFTGLITTQKAYSASSKIITTADQMLDELINIIR